jgi:hypothetical protein
MRLEACTHMDVFIAPSIIVALAGAALLLAGLPGVSTLGAFTVHRRRWMPRIWLILGLALLVVSLPLVAIGVGVLGAVATVAVPVGMAMLLVGWRGRQVSDHPHCVRCGYDLVGRPEQSSACSECGADLNLPGSIHIGRRTMRLAPLLLGLGLFLPGAIRIGFDLYRTQGQTDLSPYKPAWVLLWEMSEPNPSDAAMLELLSRMKQRTLSQAETSRIVDRALAIQADRAIPWSPKWGWILEDARAVGRLSDERWDQYLRQGYLVKLVIRPAIRQGDPLPLWVPSSYPRRIGAVNYGFECSPETAQIAGGQPLKLQPVRLPAEFSTPPMMQVPPKITASLTPGIHRVNVSARLKFSVSATQPAVANVGIPLSAEVTVLPREAAIPLVVEDAATQALVDRSVAVTSIFLDPQRRMTINCEWKGLPADLVHTLWLRLPGGKEIDLGLLATGSNGSGFTRYRQPATFSLDGVSTVTLTFRPEISLAKLRVQSTPVFGGEIVVPDVPVRPEGSLGLRFFGGYDMRPTAPQQ